MRISFSTAYETDPSTCAWLADGTELKDHPLLVKPKKTQPFSQDSFKYAWAATVATIFDKN